MSTYWYSLQLWDHSLNDILNLPNNHKNIYWENNEYKCFQNVHIVVDKLSYHLYVPDSFNLNWIKEEKCPPMFYLIVDAINSGVFKDQINQDFIFGEYSEHTITYSYLPIKEHKEVVKEDGSVEIHIEDIPNLIGKIFIAFSSSYGYDVLTKETLSLLKKDCIFESQYHDETVIMFMLDSLFNIESIRKMLSFKDSLLKLENEYSKFKENNLKLFMKDNIHRLCK